MFAPVTRAYARLHARYARLHARYARLHARYARIRDRDDGASTTEYILLILFVIAVSIAVTKYLSPLIINKAKSVTFK